MTEAEPKTTVETVEPLLLHGPFLSMSLIDVTHPPVLSIIVAVMMTIIIIIIEESCASCSVFCYSTIFVQFHSVLSVQQVFLLETCVRSRVESTGDKSLPPHDTSGCLLPVERLGEYLISNTIVVVRAALWKRQIMVETVMFC